MPVGHSLSHLGAPRRRHSLGGLNSTHLFVTVPEGGKAKTKVLGSSVPREDSSWGLVDRDTHTHTVDFLVSLLIRALIPFMSTARPPSRPSHYKVVR